MRRFYPALAVALAAAVVLLGGCDRTTAEEHLQRAEAQLEAGNLDAAVIELRNSLQKDPELIAARRRLGELHLRRGRYDSALIELERAHDLGAERASVIEGMMKAKLELGRHEEVLGELADEAELDPALLVIYGDARFALGEVEQARDAYERAVAKAQPPPAGALVGLGRVTWQLGDGERTGAYFEQARELPDVGLRELVTIGEFELGQRRTERARESFERAAALPGPDTAAWLGVARSHLVENQLAEADEVIERLLAANADLPAANYLRGLIRYREQRFDEAQSALQRVQRIVADHRPTLLLMGLVQAQQGELGQAQRLLEQYLSRDPASLTARKALAGVHLEEGRPERAAEVLASQPQEGMDAQAYALLGAARFRAGQLEQASAAFEAAIGLASEPAPAGPSTDEAGVAAEDLAAALELERGREESQVMLIVTLLRDNRFAAAKEEVEGFIEAQPENPLGYNFLGAAHLGLGDEERAEAAFERALELDPGYHPAARNLARLELGRGDPEAAKGRYEALLEHDGDHLMALLGLARLTLDAGEAETAEAYLMRAAEAHPQAMEPRLARAQLRYRRNDHDTADELVEELLGIDPEHLPALLLRARLDLDAGRRDRAGDIVARLHRRMRDLGEPDAAMLFSLARMQIELGRSDRAAGHLRRVVDITDSTHTGALRELARIEIGRRNWSLAAMHIEAIERAAPDESLHQLLRGDLSRARGELEPAIERYREAAGRGSLDAALRLATALLAAGRADEARREYERLLDELPENPVVLNNLAWLYFEHGDPRARDLAERAHEQAPESPAVADTLGWILLHEDEIERALDLLSEAAAASGEDPTIRYHLATARKRAGETEEARSILRELIDSDDAFPERDSAQALLSELE